MSVKLPQPDERWTPEYQRRFNAELEKLFGGLNVYRQVPHGGTSGQVLQKVDARDYNLGWATPSGGVTVHSALTGLAANDHPQYQNKKNIGASWVRGSGVIAVPVNDVSIYIQNASIILGVSVMTTGGVGSCVVDIWKDAIANYPPTVADTITAAAKPTISGGLTHVNTTLTGWTTALAAGDTVTFHLDSSSVFTSIFITLQLRENT